VTSWLFVQFTYLMKREHENRQDVEFIGGNRHQTQSNTQIELNIYEQPLIKLRLYSSRPTEHSGFTTRPVNVEFFLCLIKHHAMKM
jgi:hypothetical protein